MIVGERVALAAFDRRHLDATRRWLNDPETARLMDRARPISDAEHAAWYEAVLSRADAVFFAAESLDEPAVHMGNVWLWDIDPRHRKAELRIVLGESIHRGKGMGAEAIQLICCYGFERLNLHKIYAYVLEINARAMRAFEKAGFAVEATLRHDRWLGSRFGDVHLLSVFAKKSTEVQTALLAPS